jgi:hypothetical protein
MMPGEPRWRIEDNIRSITLHQRGRTQPLTAAGALAICLFWNGIVGVFVVQLIRDFQWLLALFLVPFVVIGLAIIGVFFFALTNGFRATEWTIDSNELVRYRRGLLLRRTRRWTIGRLMRTTIDDTGTSSQPNQLRLSDGTWRVSLIDNTDTQIAVIDGLTEEQARALNEVILRNLIR